MSSFSSINILDLIDAIGETETIKALEGFGCIKNLEIETYIHKNAIEFSKRKISVTHLITDEDSNIVGYFTLTHKPSRIAADVLSNQSINKIERYAKIDSKTNQYDVSAFLIAQFGKNSSIESSLSGDEMMNIAMNVLRGVQKQIGGGVVFLECEDKEKLLKFYQNENNRFKVYGERYSDNDNIKYVQLMKLF